MTVRVVHTPCGQPIDLTDDNRIVTAGTDVPHHCTRPVAPTDLTCTNCSQPVLLAPNNRILTSQPTRLGIYDPTTGDALSTADIQARVRTTGAAGHGNHRCPEPTQAAFFDLQEEAG